MTVKESIKDAISKIVDSSSIKHSELSVPLNKAISIIEEIEVEYDKNRSNK